MGEFEDETEVVDRAEDEFSADYLVGKYQMAFGKDWRIWWEEDNAKRTNVGTD
jgi:hypothetical protein